MLTVRSLSITEGLFRRGIKWTTEKVRQHWKEIPITKICYIAKYL